MRRLKLSQFQSPGDICVLTAAIRDLHTAYPSQFTTELNTSCPAIWENNPLHQSAGDGAEEIYMEYPLIRQSNECGLHMIHGFRLFMEEVLGVQIAQGPIRGCLHLSDDEQDQECPFPCDSRPVWIINAGGKLDYTCKQWSYERYQEVVNQTPDIHWVQVGAMEHEHPRLENVTSLIGQTRQRELIVLASKVDGILTANSFPMHLAAAWQKPAVVINGGREPRSWCQYEHQVFLSNDGELDCCPNGGCWKSRVEPLNDGWALGDGTLLDSKLCARPVQGAFGRLQPICMSMITTGMVVTAIRGLLK